MADFLTLLRTSLQSEELLLLVLSRPRAETRAQKLTARPCVIREQLMYQLTTRTGAQETHENLTGEELQSRVEIVFGHDFAHAHLFTTQADYRAKCKTSGQVKLHQSPPSRQPAELSHNRTKQYLIPENEPCAFLQEIGVMTANGRVKSAKQHKFRQINRFLELVNDTVAALPAEGVLQVIDFGCGKSYLTFALHHLLTNIHDRDVNISGLDLKADVIAHCNDIARKLNCGGLEFRVGDLSKLETEDDRQIDLCVSLHACDTATDFALARAIGWNARVILAAPCCQHELASQINSPALSVMTEHGILQERFSALATDAIRARLLELAGYATQVVEFISMEHTAKNLLIRAIRQPCPPANREQRQQELQQFHALLGVESLTLSRLLQDAEPRRE